VEQALYFLRADFWSYPTLVGLFVLSIFIVVLFRYLLFAWLYQAIVRSLYRAPKRLKDQQYWREVRWSAISSGLFAILSTMCFWAFQHGYTKIYVDFDAYSLGYFFFSIVVVLVAYETYYYWLHRWMHKPGVFRIVHKVHHESVSTSVFTSFSFHPLEALLQFIFLPVVIFILPLHYVALAIVLMAMTISAIVNHAGIEIFPRKFYAHPVGKWLIGSTHHELHHKEFTRNFGLYFTFWDKLMNTESNKLAKRFEENKDVLSKRVS
jgi:Delta7-sterol 5-desaturase